MSNGGKFEPGQSGNPTGKAKGTRHRTTLAMEALLEGEAEALTRKAIELALDGDGPALRLCMDRLYPPRKDRPVTFEMPAILTANDVRTATGAIVRAVAAGDLTPDEAGAVAGVIELHRRSIETSDIAARLDAIEARLQAGKGATNA